MSDLISGSWLSGYDHELNRLFSRSLGRLSTDQPGDRVQPLEVFDEAITLKQAAILGATGWGKSAVAEPASSPDAHEDNDNNSRNEAHDAFESFVLGGGHDYGFDIPIDSSQSDHGPTFEREFWVSVDRGRSQDAGIKIKPVPGLTLKELPGEMKYSSKHLKPYQLQDVGQLALVDQAQKCPGSLHDMGLGKTIQAIAVCEANWVGPVLVIVPAMLRDAWIAELHATVPRRKVCDYRDRVDNPQNHKSLQAYDYVVVSYQTVEREYAQGHTFAKHQDLRMQGKTHEVIEPTKSQRLQGGPKSKTRYIPLEQIMPTGLLHAIQWQRVVCDEAHMLKGNGKTTNAVCALLRKHGLYITGTPQQNGYKDWFAAFRFARLRPFCDNEARFKQYFVNKQKSSINEYERLEEGRSRMLSLLVRGFCLRRRKEDKFNGELPLEKIEVVEHPTIYVKPDDGTKFPDHPQTEKSCQENLRHHWEQGGSGKASKKANRARLRRHIFAEITAASQATVHPAVLEAPKLSKKAARENSKALAEYKKWLADIEENPSRRKWRSSSIVALLKIIRKHVAAMKKGAPDSGGGIIVFARFRPVLDIINIAVRQEIGEGVGCVQYDGRLNDEQRERNLNNFKRQASLEHLVLLTTPNMGGLGHNFIEASCLINTTPHFNPFVDIQLKARAARPGQTRTVHIWQISMEESFDVRIGYVQGRKISNAEDITEWDKRQRQAVLEAEGWTEDDFNQGIQRIWIAAAHRGQGGEELDSEKEYSSDDDSEYQPTDGSDSD